MRCRQRGAPGADRIVDEMPANFTHLGLVHPAPAGCPHHSRPPRSGRYLHMSCCSQFFTGNQPFSFDLGELGRYYRGCEILMQCWRDVLPKGVMIGVQYKKLVHDRECAFA
jgi:hypothetical protein